MGKLVLPAGTKRAVHVYTKQLMERMKDNQNQMLWLVRSSMYNYTKALVCRKVEIAGPATGEDLFDTPLPGTNGRGVAILFTKSEVTLHFEGDQIEMIEMEDKPKPEKVVQPAAAAAAPAGKLASA